MWQLQRSVPLMRVCPDVLYGSQVSFIFAGGFDRKRFFFQFLIEAKKLVSFFRSISHEKKYKNLRFRKAMLLQKRSFLDFKEILQKIFPKIET